ncbi:MAG: hypothetical protein ABI560_18830, partial [Myxococcales bacterium]
PCIYDENVTPLIAKQQPLPGTFDKGLDLVVLKVEDDGDWAPRMFTVSPYAEFRWSVKKSGDESFHYVGGNYTKYTVPAIDYSLGDLVKVRVEFLDRNRAKIESILKTCADRDDFCPMTSTCHQRVTWTIQY